MNELRPHSIILASCKPGFRLAWACRKHVASRSKACQKQVESHLQTCLKPCHDRTSRLKQQVRDQFFDKKSRKHVESMSQIRTTCRKFGCKPGRKPGLQPGLQLARIMECGLYWLTIHLQRLYVLSRCPYQLTVALEFEQV